MDKDRIKGTVKKVEGTLKQKLGQLSGDKSLEVEGTIETVEGTLQTAFGEAKDALKKG